MESVDTLITVASWEERFTAGMGRNLACYRPRRVLMYFLDRYAEWTAEPRKQVEELCRGTGVKCDSHELSVDNPSMNWNCLSATIVAADMPERTAVVDLTTMPREIIWTVLWFLEYLGVEIGYVYHRPNRYAKDWLSKDSQKPRLVYKLSGAPRLGLKTALVVLAGYDVERIAQLMNHFEPSVTLLGLQAAAQDADNEQRMAAHTSRFGPDPSVATFVVDAYAADHGRDVIWRAVSPYLASHNVIMSSLGPKTTAIALYRLNRENPALGLAYAPSREFNREYSRGIGDAIHSALWPAGSQ